MLGKNVVVIGVIMGLQGINLAHFPGLEIGALPQHSPKNREL